MRSTRPWCKDHLRGRVLSVRVLVAFSGRPVGTMAGALLAQAAGLPATFLIAGLIPAAAALVTFFLPLMNLWELGKVGTGVSSTVGVVL